MYYSFSDIKRKTGSDSVPGYEFLETVKIAANNTIWLPATAELRAYVKKFNKDLKIARKQAVKQFEKNINKQAFFALNAEFERLAAKRIRARSL